jgi:hypothetical protein
MNERRESRGVSKSLNVIAFPMIGFDLGLAA